MSRKLRIGVLISGSGSNLQAIIDACVDGRIDGEVVFVGSDVPDVHGLERAQKANIPTFVVDYQEMGRDFTNFCECMTPSHVHKDIQDMITKSDCIVPSSITDPLKRFRWLYKRIMIENELLLNVEKFEIDLLVLAGFMRKLTAYFIDRINCGSMLPRIMNIHPALLPSFAGTNGYEDTFDHGCKAGGCTVHFVDYGEDTGPIIGQLTIPILPGDTIDMVKKRGLAQEWMLYPECIQLFAHDRLRVVENDHGRKIVVIS